MSFILELNKFPKLTGSQHINSYCVASLSPSLLQSFIQTSDSSFIPGAIEKERKSTYIFGKRISDYHTAARITFKYGFAMESSVNPRLPKMTGHSVLYSKWNGFRGEM